MFLCVYKIKKGRKKCIIIIHTRWYAKLDHIWYIYTYKWIRLSCNKQCL